LEGACEKEGVHGKGHWKVPESRKEGALQWSTIRGGDARGIINQKKKGGINVLNSRRRGERGNSHRIE